MNLSRAKNLVLRFEEIGLDDTRFVGARNASIGAGAHNFKLREGCYGVGFATTAKAFQLFLDQNGLRRELASILGQLDAGDSCCVAAIGEAVRSKVSETPLPESIVEEISK